MVLKEFFEKVNFEKGQQTTKKESQNQDSGWLFVIILQQGRLSAEKMQDERCNRVSSVLIGLGTVMCVSPVCEKKAVFAVCQMIKEKHIEIDLVIQVNHGHAVRR